LKIAVEQYWHNQGISHWRLRPHSGLKHPLYYYFELVSQPAPEAELLLLTPVLNAQEIKLLSAIRFSLPLQASQILHATIGLRRENTLQTLETIRDRIASMALPKIICFGWLPTKIVLDNDHFFEKNRGQQSAYHGVPVLIVDELKRIACR